jgi:hypothetical protein
MLGLRTEDWNRSPSSLAIYTQNQKGVKLKKQRNVLYEWIVHNFPIYNEISGSHGSECDNYCHQECSAVWSLSLSLLALMMEAVSTSERSVRFYETTRGNIPQDVFLQQRDHRKRRTRRKLGEWSSDPHLIRISLLEQTADSTVQKSRVETYNNDVNTLTHVIWLYLLKSLVEIDKYSEHTT